MFSQIMSKYVHVLLYVFNTLVFVNGNYPCLCCYTIETSVHSSRNVTSNTLGYMYEFDCKPTFPTDGSGNSKFYAVQYENQIGYIANVPGYLTIESCPGTLPSADAVTTISPAMTPISKSIEKSSTTTSTPTATSPTTTTPKTTLISTTTSTTSPSTTASTSTRYATSPTTTVSMSTRYATTPTATSTRTPFTQTIPTATPSATTTPKKKTTPATTRKKTTALTTTKTTETTKQITRHGQACPDPWLRKDQSCYYFNLQDKMAHMGATHKCSQLHAHLVFINSNLKQRWISLHLHQYPNYNTKGLQHSAVWTGGKNKNNTWIWVNGNTKESTPFGYNHWSPNHFPLHSDTNNMCAAMIGDDHSKWVDFNCHNKFYFICERPIYTQSSIHHSGTPQLTSTTRTTTTTKSSGTCPSRWIQYADKCYFVNIHEHLTQKNASKVCSQLNSHLAFVQNLGEQQFLENYLRRVSKHGNQSFWIGIHHRNHGWHWDSNSVVESVSYTNWSPSQIGGNCATIAMKLNFRWHRIPCNNSHHYICEMKMVHTLPLVG